MTAPVASATSVKVHGLDDPNVKAFGAKDLDQIVVMLLNENRGTPALSYTVRLDTLPIIGAPESRSALEVNINASVSRQYNPPLGAGELELAAESTVMLVFDEDGDLVTRHVYGLSSGTAEPTVYTN